MYMIFINLNNWYYYYDGERKRRQGGRTTFVVIEEDNENEVDSVEATLDDELTIQKKCLYKVGQHFLVPNFFGLSSSILAYSVIGFTNAFNSARIYCLFISNII